MLRAGDTYTLEGGHLYIVVAVCEHAWCLTYSVSTPALYKPKICDIARIEHPWLHHTSWVIPTYGQIGPVTRLEQRIAASGKKRETVKQNVVDSILKGMPSCEDCEESHLNFVAGYCNHG